MFSFWNALFYTLIHAIENSELCIIADICPLKQSNSWEHFCLLADFFSDSSLLGKSRFQDDTPKFVQEPNDSYHIVRNKPASVECKAINAVRINFRCAGQFMEPTYTENIVDQDTSTKILSAFVNVERADVEEYFGGVFWCECFAYNTNTELDGVGGIKSKQGTIEIACKYELSALSFLGFFWSDIWRRLNNSNSADPAHW